MTNLESTSADSRSLRRQLFGSHLLVMAVALVVLLIGVGIVIGLFELFGAHNELGRRSQGGPFGLAVGVAAAALASAIVSWRVSRSLAEPLDEIGDATRQLAAGRYDVRVPGSDTVELDRLAADVNHLAMELETTEHRRLRLIGDVAHELRNPLSTIEGTMEALLDGVVDPEPDTFARLGREAARLRRLADDLSSLSAAGELDIVASEDVDMFALASTVVAQLEPQAEAKGLRLTVEARDRAQTSIVVGDRDRLTQVLTNVIGNAVQYTDNGSIEVAVSSEVSVSSSADHVRLQVTDTGRGVAPGDLETIFERFFRVDHHFSDGTGVGLAIAKLIVEAHAGRIVASSNGLGEGSTFTIELPRAAAPT